MKEAIWVVVGGYAAVVALMFVFQRSLQYFPDTTRPDPGVARAFGMTVVAYRTDDGLDLQSWYRDAAPGKPTVVYFHGNGGNIMGRAPKVRDYADLGYGVLLAEYRGYGGNPGSPSEEGFYRDGRAALAFLEAQGVTPGDTVILGESLGSGVAVHLARERALAGSAPRAVVLEAPFSSAVDVGAAHYSFIPIRLMMKDRYQSIDKIKEIGAPLLIIQGEDDRVVPIRFGKRLFEAAVEPKTARWVPGAGHGDLHDFGLAGTVGAFLEALGGGG